MIWVAMIKLGLLIWQLTCLSLRYLTHHFNKHNHMFAFPCRIKVTGNLSWMAKSWWILNFHECWNVIQYVKCTMTQLDVFDFTENGKTYVIWWMRRAQWKRWKMFTNTQFVKWILKYRQLADLSPQSSNRRQSSTM